MKLMKCKYCVYFDAKREDCKYLKVPVHEDMFCEKFERVD